MNTIRTNLYFLFICFPLRRVFYLINIELFFYAMRMKDCLTRHEHTELSQLEFNVCVLHLKQNGHVR